MRTREKITRDDVRANRGWSIRELDGCDLGDPVVVRCRGR